MLFDKSRFGNMLVWALKLFQAATWFLLYVSEFLNLTNLKVSFFPSSLHMT